LPKNQAKNKYCNYCRVEFDQKTENHLCLLITPDKHHFRVFCKNHLHELVVCITIMKVNHLV
jgi:hypothetical protein